MKLLKSPPVSYGARTRYADVGMLIIEAKNHQRHDVLDIVHSIATDPPHLYASRVLISLEVCSERHCLYPTEQKEDLPGKLYSRVNYKHACTERKKIKINE